MDRPDFYGREAAETFRQIALINRLTTAYRPTLRAIDYFWTTRHRGKESPLRLLDIGSGYGDFLRVIRHWADKRGIAVQLTGIDLNPWAIQAARQADRGERIRYKLQDVFDLHPKKRFHVMINSLVTHHLNDWEIVRLLRWMTDQSVYGWFINDLHRHRFAYDAIRHATRWLGFNRYVQNDAPQSVARSFTRNDWERLLHQAKIDRGKIRITWFWPFRYGVLYHAA